MARLFKQLKEYIRTNITHISPTLNTRIRYWRAFRKPIDLKNPRTLDEKIQWLKLNTYYKNPLVTQCADKYAVRQYVQDCGCGEILNQLYFAWDSVDEIDWDKLPDSFVIKWNFGCGYNLICRDKSKLDIEQAKVKLKEWRKGHKTYYLTYSEMQYKDIKPKLICERLIETEDGTLPQDYKLYCFNGQAQYILVCSGRDDAGQGAKYYFFDSQWQLQRLNRAGKEAPDGFTLPKPQGIDQLFHYADKLSKPFPFVRADFYLEKGRVIFGELTFTPCGGLDNNRLPETQILFGDKVRL